MVASQASNVGIYAGASGAKTARKLTSRRRVVKALVGFRFLSWFLLYEGVFHDWTVANNTPHISDLLLHPEVAKFYLAMLAIDGLLRRFPFLGYLSLCLLHEPSKVLWRPTSRRGNVWKIGVWPFRLALNHIKPVVPLGLKLLAVLGVGLSYNVPGVDELAFLHLVHGHEGEPLAACKALPLRGERYVCATLGTVLAKRGLPTGGTELHLPIGNPVVPILAAPFTDVDAAWNPLGYLFYTLAVTAHGTCPDCS